MFSRPTRTHVERLENRWLLALTPVSAELVVPGADPAVAADLAVAADGSYLIASAVAAAGGTTANITAVRYSPSGVPVGSPITLDTTGATFLGINSPPIAASVDADGDAVVAYRRDDGVYVVRLSKDGVAGAPLRVDTTPADRFVDLPTVSMDDAAAFVYTTRVGGSINPNRDVNTIYARRYDASGAPDAGGLVVINTPPFD